MSDAAGIGVVERRRALGERLFERYRLPLLKFFSRRTRTPGEAEDLVQDLIRRLMERDDLSDVDEIDAFIFATARNLLKDRARRAAVRERSHADLAAMGSDIEVLHPERVIQAKQDVVMLMAALAELDEKPRDMFIMHRLDGMKQREIADAYGLSLSSVEKHLRKALAHIMKKVDLE